MPNHYGYTMVLQLSQQQLQRQNWCCHIVGDSTEAPLCSHSDISVCVEYMVQLVLL